MQIVEREYAELFPGEVESVHVVHDTAAMNSLVKEYAKIKGKLEDLLDDYTSKKRRHMKIKRKTVRAPVPASHSGFGVFRVQGLGCGPWVRFHTSEREVGSADGAP